MLKFIGSLGALVIVASATVLVAQPPAFRGGGNRRGGGDVVAGSVAKMMAFDKDEDGKLSKAEVTDARLEALFDRADADKDGVVTKEELTALFTREAASVRAGGGPGGRGGPPPGGPGGAGRFGPPEGSPFGRPRIGEVLPRFLQDELELTSRQRAKLDELQADVDERLARILTEEQRQTLAEMRDRGPGGPPPGGPGGFPPGGPRPGGRDGFGPPRDGGAPPRED
ncbi:MAG TPA: EF-hand domain-containing protein [Pirellulales bacterium]|nr:EF-hand domain-containing protein [Pirellulales bacterium]